MHIIIFEDDSHLDLRPFTFTRPVFELRAGIFTLRERWERTLGQSLYTLGSGHLYDRYTKLPPSSQQAVWINGKWIPDRDLLNLIREAEPHTYYVNPQHEVLAANFSPSLLPGGSSPTLTDKLLDSLGLKRTILGLSPEGIRQRQDIFLRNESLISHDFNLITQSQASEEITDPHTRVYGKDNLFVSPGVKVRAAIINAEDGPVYLGREAKILEGAMIRRSHAICDHAEVSMGARLRGDSTLGPYAKGGGEITNSVIMGYSNKAHEGYLGNSVLGYWCNLGADSNTSNLKNNYSHVKAWSYRSKRFEDTGLQFYGLMMGDHSKCAINTMFNTGTVVGISSNIFGAGFPRTYIPSFSWGGAHGFTQYRLDKALEVVRAVVRRRGFHLDEQEEAILSWVYDRRGDE